MAYYRRRLIRRRYYRNPVMFYTPKLKKNYFNYKKMNFASFRVDIPLRFATYNDSKTPRLMDSEGTIVGDQTHCYWDAASLLVLSNKWVTFQSLYSSFRVRGIKLEVKRVNECQNAIVNHILAVVGESSTHAPDEYDAIAEIPKALMVTDITEKASIYKRLYTRWRNITTAEMNGAFSLYIMNNKQDANISAVFALTLHVYISFRNAYA